MSSTGQNGMPWSSLVVEMDSGISRIQFIRQQV